MEWFDDEEYEHMIEIMNEINRGEVMAEALVKKEEAGATIQLDWDFIKRAYCAGASDKEFELFMVTCKVNNLNPMKREAYFVKYGDKPGQCVTEYKQYIANGERTGKLNGWNVALDSEDSPKKATITIHRKDWTNPLIWSVYASEFNKGYSTWKTMPRFMLMKVAIAQGFRMAFPEECGALPYLSEEVVNFETPKEPAKPKTTTPKATETVKDPPKEDKPGDKTTDKNIKIGDRLRQQVREMIKEMSNTSEESGNDILEKHSKFKNKDGEWVGGRRNIDDISDKQAGVVYGKVKDAWSEWKAKQIIPDAKDIQMIDCPRQEITSQVDVGYCRISCDFYQGCEAHKDVTPKNGTPENWGGAGKTARNSDKF